MNRILEKIEAKGLLQQHQQLVALGYDKPWKNLRLLEKFNSDVQLVVERYQQKEAEHKKNDEGFLQALDKLGYLNHHEALVKQGYTRPERNLKLLLRFQGDIQKVEGFLLEKTQKNCDEKQQQGDAGHHRHGRGGHKHWKHHSRSHSKDGNEQQEGGHKHWKNRSRSHSKGHKDKDFNALILKHGFQLQNDKLQELGFVDAKLNFKLLKKNKGDLEAVLVKLLEKSRKIKKVKYESLKKNQDFLARKDRLKEKLKTLKQSGLKKKKQALKLLAMYDGNEQAVLQLFNLQQTPQGQVQKSQQ
ncbi:hypothetical protein pb186bvf_017362 [Paramecium bursaria]